MQDVNPSIELTLESITHEYETIIVQYFTRMQIASNKRTESNQNELKISNSIHTAEEELTTCETSQVEAIENDDFDRADQLNERIEELKTHIVQMKEQMKESKNS